MNCEKARRLLDAYIDGELSAEEIRALKDHAQACEACKCELEAAEMLRDTFADMDDEIVVPLEAQAAWKRAIRVEAQKKNGKKVLRAVYAVAAALVLVVGGTAIYGRMGDADQPVMLMKEAAPMTASVVARDGGASQGNRYTAWKKIATDAPQDAYASFEMLASEYNGTCAWESEDICRIELPYEYMQDFLNAGSRIGTELSFEIYDESMQTAIILIQFCEP